MTNSSDLSDIQLAIRNLGASISDIRKQANGGRAHTGVDGLETNIHFLSEALSKMDERIRVLEMESRSRTTT